MTSMQEEMDDSRTSSVGRKRNLEEIQDQGQEQSSLRPSSEDNAQRATKRVKEDDEPLEDGSVEDALTNTASLLSAASPSLASEASPTQPIIAAPPRAGAWNKGVQSGLRTSFGNRVHTKPKPKPFIPSNQEEDIDPTSNPMSDSSNTEHPRTFPAVDPNREDAALAETLGLPEMHVSSPVNQDGEDSAMAEVIDLPEKQPWPAVKQSERNVNYASPKANTSPVEMTVSSGEEEGEISSSKGTGDEAGMLHEQTPGSFGQYAGVGSSLRKGEGDIENFLHLQAPPFRDEYGGPAADSTLNTDLQKDESSGAPGWLFPSSRHDSSGAEASTDTISQANNTSTPFRFLTKAEQAKLSEHEKAVYLEAKKPNLHVQKIKDFERRTVAAEAVFSHELLPLPSQYKAVENDIASGLTYFPKEVAGRLQFYKRSPNWYKLSEILNDDRPIRVQNFSFNIFAPAFLKENRELWDYIDNQRVLSAAFNCYINLYYQHCTHIQMGDWKDILMRSASDRSAITVEEAKRIAMDSSPQPQSMSDAPIRSAQTFPMANEAQRVAGDGHSHLQSMSEAPKPSENVSITVEEAQHDEESSDDKIAAKGARGAKNAERRARRREAREAREKATPQPKPQPTLPAPSVSAATGTSSHLRSMNDVPPRLESPNDFPVNEPVEIDLDQVEIDPMERELQQKYFPATIDRPAIYHCLACGNNCHMTFDCPSFTCTLCGGDHAQSACPQNQRCRKCRQRGHQEVECPEKLAISRGEAVGCDFCGLTDHLEVACHFIWRTFNPRPKEIRKVHEIPVHCYSCGATGHYGPECGLSKVRRILSGGQTFSKANVLKYVDASSAVRNISAGVDYSIQSRPTKVFNIKGMANDPIELDESDEEITFISEKVKKPKQHGQINIATPNRSKLPDRSGIGHSPQETDLSHPRNPPREPRPDYGRNFGGNLPSGVDSARYGRERTFSPPPRFDDMRYGVPGADDRFRPQAQHEDFYRLQPQAQYSYQPANQNSLPARPPLKPSSNAPRGGGNFGGGRGGGNNRGGREKRKKKGKVATNQGPSLPIGARTRSKKQKK